MRVPRLLLMCLLLALLGGCAYFNTYYNAHSAYRMGMKKKLESAGANAGESFFKESNTVSSKLLQFYPKSRWVDDTVLLIGLCYLELGQHHRALRKFDELESNYPDSDLIEPSRVWRARTYLELNRLEECRRQLAALNEERLDREERLQKLQVEADLARIEKQWDRLTVIQQEILKETRKRTRKGVLNLAIGHSLEKLGDYKEAVKYFDRVGRYRPGKLLELEADLAEVDNLIRLERFPKATNQVERLEKDERFHDLADQIALRRAALTLAEGQVESAMVAYNGLLETYPRTPSSAQASFHLGDMWLYRLGQADSARVYYARCKQEAGRSPWADSSTVRLEDLDAVDAVRSRLLELENALQQARWSLDPDSARVYHVRGQLATIRTRLQRDSTALVGKARQAADSSLLQLYTGRERSLADSLAALTDSLPAWAWQRALVPPDSGRTNNQTLVEEAEEGESRAGRRKLFQNRRQKDEARADSLLLAQMQDSLSRVETVRRQRLLDSLLVHSVLDTLSQLPPIDSLAISGSQDSLSLVLYDSKFELAEMLYYRLRDPRRADSLMAHLDSLEGSALRHSRLLFSWALLKEERLAQPEEGRALLERVVAEYPLSRVANPARDRLGLPRTLTEADSAMFMLEDAEALWLASFQPAAALERYRSLQTRYPESDAALTGHLAQAQILLEIYGDPDGALDQWKQALRAFPDDPRLATLKTRLGGSGLASESGPAAEEPAQVAEGLLLDERKDDSGHFVRPEGLDNLEKLLEHIRTRFQDTGRLRLERVLH